MIANQIFQSISRPVYIYIYIYNLCSNLQCGTVPNALLKSRYIVSPGQSSSIALVIISRVIKRFVKHDLLSMNPCWTELISLFTFK